MNKIATVWFRGVPGSWNKQKQMCSMFFTYIFICLEFISSYFWLTIAISLIDISSVSFRFAYKAWPFWIRAVLTEHSSTVRTGLPVVRSSPTFITKCTICHESPSFSTGCYGLHFQKSMDSNGHGHRRGNWQGFGCVGLHLQIHTSFVVLADLILGCTCN